LANEHGTNAKTHDEQTTKAVQQVHATFELCAIRINDRDSDDGNETVERVKRWEHCFVAVDHDDAKDYLNKHRELRNADVPPQCAGTQRDEFVGGERPDACKAIANNDNPGPVGVEVIESFGVHRINNLPHRGGGFIAGVAEGEIFAVVYMKRGDGTVVEVGNH
jgi:hypothetical protein